MKKLTDRTGRPGPRGWSNQRFPEGKAEHPVTGITWYEAAAYAAFRGKTLPTIFQWEKAARFRWERFSPDGANNVLGVTMPWGLLDGPTEGRANFSSSGTVPAGSMEFGMSPYGCYDMAGNVSEWCLNETSKGFIASGGSWGSHGLEFGYYGTYPGFLDSNLVDRVGFRCVWNPPGAGDQVGMRINLDASSCPQIVTLGRNCTWLRAMGVMKLRDGSPHKVRNMHPRSPQSEKGRSARVWRSARVS